MRRRSFSVGRPVKLPRTRPGAVRLRSGGGELRSTTHSAATEALTLRSITVATSRMRSQPSMRTVTTSPTRTGLDGLVTPRFTATGPERHASVATLRVLNTRTDNNQRSTRMLSTPSILSETWRAPVQGKRAPVGLRCGCP
jgi:hypothetical protein